MGTKDDAFAISLREAIRARGLSLSALCARLTATGNPVAVSTLSYWQSGRRRPEGAASLAVVEELERILALDPRTLTGRIGPSRRTGRADRPGPVYGDDRDEMLADMLALVGASPSSASRELSTSVVAVTGADGRVIEYRSRHLMQATTAADVAAFAIVVPLPGPGSESPTIQALGGGSVGAVHIHPTGAMIGARFDLHEPVRAPETALFEYSLRVPDAYPPQFALGSGAIRRTRETTLWVQFDDAALPDWIVEVEYDGLGETVLSRDALRGRTTHATRRNWGPGWFGLRWGFHAGTEE